MEYPVVTWIAALVSTLIGFGTLIHFSWIAARWPTTTGRIVGNNAKRSHGGPGRPSTTSYFPEIAFYARTGKEVIVSGDVGKPEPYPIGSAIKVWYRPSNPGHAMTMTWWQRLVFSLFFVAVAAVCWALIFGMIDGNGRLLTLN